MLNPRKDRTELRLQLYRNGFTPLPNHMKACFLKNWSHVDVTEDMICSREWARSRRWSDTGIRCGDIVALDFDIDDADLLNDLLDAVIEEGLIEQSDFVRIGKPPRELWVYRTSEKFGKRTTGGFMTPGHEDQSFKLEVLGGGSQFAAYGQRDEETPYTWPEKSLVDYQYEDLPEITVAQVTKLIEFCEDFFERRGLDRVSPGVSAHDGYTNIYDLTDDMVFDVKDEGRMTVSDIAALLERDPSRVLRCTVDILRPTSGSWAGMVSLVNGLVCLSDHGTYTAHYPKMLDLSGKLERLGSLVLERYTRAEDDEVRHDSEGFYNQNLDMDPSDPLDNNEAKALKRFAYCEKTDTIYDLWENKGPYKPTHFRSLMAPFHRVEQGPRGGQTIIHLFDLWMRSPGRLNAYAVAMHPNKPIPVFEERDRTFVNSYRKLALPTDGDPAPGFELLTRLLPNESERAWFVKWMAHKVLYPHVRGPGVIMVAHDSYGTGRGTLIDLLALMFGDSYVRRIDFDTMTGGNYQSQYNEWLADSLILAVNEAQEIRSNQTSWRVRNNAYEHIKSMLEPGESIVEVKRKGQDNYQGRTFASIIIATNHSDALVIPANDRRLAVLSNGEPQPTSYWRTVRKWMANDANIGAFISELEQVSLADYDPFSVPIMTQAKAEMVAAGVSDLDRAFQHVLSALPAPVVVKEQVFIRIENYVNDTDLELPEDWRRSAETLLRRATHQLPGGSRVDFHGKKRAVRMLPGAENQINISNEKAIIEALDENGPTSRIAVAGNNVVGLHSARKSL